jgi:hypothetical protein
MHGLHEDEDEDDDDDDDDEAEDDDDGYELKLCIHVRMEKKPVKAKTAFGMRTHHHQLYH